MKAGLTIGLIEARQASFLWLLERFVPRPLKRMCSNLSIEDFRFHDLRHTAASWLRMQGADIHTVAQLLGHKDLRMAARYQHLSPAFLAEAVGRLDAVIGEVCYQDRYRAKSINLWRGCKRF
jgi:integrase